MTRIAIIGNAGGGKTTLARQLGAKLDLPVYSVDRVQWKPHWQAADPAEVAAHQATWLAGGRWIIDGFGGDALIEERFAAADTLIFVDYPLYIHFWWATKRQFTSLWRERDDMPPDCPMLPMTWQLFKTMMFVQRVLRPRIMTMLLNARQHATLIHLRHPAATSAWLATL